MTTMTYGFQLRETHIIVAANGIGKTEFVKELMFHFLEEGLEIGLFSFEQTPADTMRRLIGAKLGLKLHLPGSEWPVEKIKQQLIAFDGKIHLCDRTGSIKLEELFLYIKYLSKACNKKVFFIDNLRGLGIGHDIELAGNFMRKLQALNNELGITVFLLSHVSKDKMQKQVYVSTSPKNKAAYEAMTGQETQDLIEKPGMNWESGRMPTTENVDGPSVICDLANYVWALARNKVSEDFEESHTIKVKGIKTRLDGEYTGKTFKLFYNTEGRLIETDGLKKHEIDAFKSKGDF
jgi:archaellum biogenesis ATPase FlaH